MPIITQKPSGALAARTLVDHITVTAPSLEAGSEFVRKALGIAPQSGGEHPRMGTHNRLLRLRESMFLEVIALNPSAIGPARPRWFALDTLTPQSMPALSSPGTPGNSAP